MFFQASLRILLNNKHLLLMIFSNVPLPCRPGFVSVPAINDDELPAYPSAHSPSGLDSPGAQISQQTKKTSTQDYEFPSPPGFVKNIPAPSRVASMGSQTSCKSKPCERTFEGQGSAEEGSLLELIRSVKLRKTENSCGLTDT